MFDVNGLMLIDVKLIEEIVGGGLAMVGCGSLAGAKDLWSLTLSVSCFA